MLVVIGSVKGAPGATTVAFGLAARWPVPGAVLVEADPAGGDLAAWFGCPPQPGLVELATATRRTAGPVALDDCAQLIGLGVVGVIAPAGRAAAGTVGVLAAGAQVLQGAARSRPVIVDVGRLDPGSAALPLLAVADVLLLVARADLASLRHVDACRDDLVDQVGSPAQVRLVLRTGGSSPGFALTSVGRDLGLPVAATVPDDPTGAGLLAGRLRARRWWTRSPLVRAIHALGTDLSSRYQIAATTAAPAGEVPDGPPIGVEALEAAS